METDQRLVARREFRAAALRGHLPCLSILASLLSSRCPLVRKRVFRLALRYFWKNYPAGTVGEFSNTPLRLFSSCLTSLCHAARCLLAIRPPSSTALSQSPQNCYCSTLLPVPQPSHPRVLSRIWSGSHSCLANPFLGQCALNPRLALLTGT